MKGAICNRLFQIRSKTRTIEIDGSIVRRYASDTERDRESYTDVCGVAGWQQPKRLGISPTSNGFDEAHDVLLDEAELVARLDHQPAKHSPYAEDVVIGEPAHKAEPGDVLEIRYQRRPRPYGGGYRRHDCRRRHP
jgi:hypothetical protein